MLTKGMFGSEFRRSEAEFAGLHCGQMCHGPTKLCHNSGWYNHLGEKLGFGDLDVADMKRISEQISDLDVFVVLPEGPSFWEFVDFGEGTHGKIDRVGESHPGQDYMVEHAMYLIMKGKVCIINRWGSKESRLTEAGLVCEVLAPEQIRDYLVRK